MASWSSANVLSRKMRPSVAYMATATRGTETDLSISPREPLLLALAAKSEEAPLRHPPRDQIDCAPPVTVGMPRSWPPTSTTAPNCLSDGFLGFQMFLKAKHATISLGLSFSKVTLSVWLLLASCGFVPRGLGEREGCILQHVSAVRCRLLRVWCLRSASDVSAPRPAFGGNAYCWTPATNNHRGTLSPQYDGTISKKRALQGPRSAREASSETADAHDSRFTSGRSGAL